MSVFVFDLCFLKTYAVDVFSVVFLNDEIVKCVCSVHVLCVVVLRCVKLSSAVICCVLFSILWFVYVPSFGYVCCLFYIGLLLEHISSILQLLDGSLSCFHQGPV